MCFLSLTLIKVPPVRHIWLTSGQFDLAINLKFEEQRGYYMLTKKTDLQKRQLPSVFTNVSPQGSNLQYDSLELCKKNAKLRHSLNEIYVLSFDTIMKLIDDVRMYIGCLYKVCEGIAMLDMVTPSIEDSPRSACVYCILHDGD
jgi:DNA mismatch repair protein MSH4